MSHPGYIRASRVISSRRGYIYLIRNLVNGKGYVGKAFDVDKRWAAHVKEARSDRYDIPLHRAIRKYGPQNFTVTIIHCCGIDHLDNAERRLIIERRTHKTNGGYNVAFGGDGGRQPGDVIRRISASMVDRWADPVYRKRQVAAIAKGSSTPKAREANSRARCARSPEVNKRQGESLRRRILNDPKLHAKLTRNSRAWHAAHPEFKAEQSERMKARLRNPIARAEISASIKQLWQDPIYRTRMIASQNAGKARRRIAHA